MCKEPVRVRLPAKRAGLTQKVTVAGYDYYITVNFFPDTSNPAELFLAIAKQGSTLSGVFDALVTVVSVALQYGVPWVVIRDKFMYTRFEPNELPDVPSIVHSIAQTVDGLIEMHKNMWDSEPRSLEGAATT